jgi:WD40 repeat protein
VDVSISSDGSYIAAGSWYNKVYFFNGAGELLWSYGTSDSVTGVSISSDSSYIVVGSIDGKVYFFNKDGALLWNYETFGSVQDIAISSDGSYVAAGSAETVYFFTNPQGFAQRSIGEWKRTIELERTKGFNMTEVESSISNAEAALSSGDYARASELVEDAKTMAENIVKEATGAKNVINETKSTISQENAKGFNVAGAEALLSHAENAFNRGDYTRASELAGDAKALAPDIYHDGVPNDSDFIPSINNRYIYAGTGILLVGSAVTLRTGLKKRKRRRLEYEETKHKILDTIEDMKSFEIKDTITETIKQETLDIIDELTKGDR